MDINTQSGDIHGSVTGGTGAYKGAAGTVKGQPDIQPGYTDITIVYHR